LKILSTFYNKPMKKTTTTIKEEYDGLKKSKLNRTRDEELKREAKRAERERELARSKLALEKALGGARGKGKNTARGQRIQDEIDLYVRQLLNPFETLNAVVPDVHSYPTTTFSVTTPFILSSNADGRACIMVRDGLTFHYATSSQTDALVYNAGWYYSAGASTWSSGSEVAAIRGTFSAYRPVAMGVRMTYDAAPVDASGRLAMGYFPGTQTLPFMSNGDTTYTLTYDAFAQYQDVLTGAAISGGTVIWKPMTPQNHFRPTKAEFYNGVNDTFAEMVYTNNVLVAQGATWDIDPEVCPSMQGLGLYEDEATALVSVASAAGHLNELCLPLNSPCIVMMAEGLPASTQCFVGEIVVHYEGIADNRAFSLVQAQHRLSSPGAMEKAIHRVNKVHPVHSGGSIQSHQSWLSEAVKITSSIANTAGAVAGVVQNVPRVVQPLLEAAETVAALF
jgi:hypothetical protein